MASNESQGVSPGVMYIEAHEEFVQHIEAGERRMRSLSLITVAVAALLSLSYVAQIVLPFATGATSVTVNVNDPTLLAFELLLLLLTLAWLGVGLRNYRFATRLGTMVKQARTAERELEKKLESAHQ